MNKLTIRTNNVPREILYWWELTAKERKEFDYLDTEDRQMETSFFRYRGWTYDLGEFMRCPSSSESSPTMRDAGFHNWDGYTSDSFFSGVLVKYTEDREHVVVATYFS